MQTPQAPDPGPHPIGYADPTTPGTLITRGDFATLAVRILGIYLLISALPSISYLVFLYSQYGTITVDGPEAWYLADTGTALIGILLALFARPLSRYALSPGVETDPAPPAHWACVALMLIGVWVLADAGPSLVTSFLSLRADAIGGRAPGHWTDLIDPAIRVAVGLLLFLNPGALFALWRRSQRVVQPAPGS